MFLFSLTPTQYLSLLILSLFQNQLHNRTLNQFRIPVR